MRTLAALALALSSTSPLLAQNVWVVDASLGPGADTDTIAHGLQLAADGDVVLVREGSYPEFVSIPNRSVVLTADAGALVEVAQLTINGVGAGRTVTIRGLDFAPTPGFFGAAALLVGVDAVVHVEDCTFEGGNVLSDGALRILQCDDVVVSRCTILAPNSSATGVASLDVEGSNAALFECVVDGGDGSSIVGTNVVATPALVAADSLVTLTGCVLHGGDGAPGSAVLACSDGSDGAPGLVVDGLGLSVVELIDTTATGGAGGTAVQPCSPGAPGQDTVVLAGTLSVRPGLAPHFRFASPLRSGDPWDFDLAALPNSFAWIVIGVAPGPIQSFAPVVDGVVTVGAPQFLVPLGNLPASGVLDASLLPGTFVLPPGLPYLPLVVQPITAEPVHGPTAGTPSALLVLDPSF
ncbi:MAG: hypothetical protein R3F34_09755 [Planctomycetota bacterium]